MEELGLGVNLVHQMPHNAVRQKVMGNENRPPTDKELKLMEDLVDQGMRDGAWGLSTGLIYNPGTYAKTEEIVALAKVAARHGGLYASHIRDESGAVLVAIEEVLTIARRAGLRVHISHIKVTGRNAWGKSTDVIALIRRARKEGLEVTADQYPYIASSTSLSATIVPARYREGSDKDFLKRLDDPEVGPKLQEEIGRLLEDKVDTLRIASYQADPKLHGKDIASIARAAKETPLRVALSILRKGGASIVSFGMNEEDLRLFMKEPYVATASDGVAMVPAATVPHPRSYGTFPRKIARYALEDKIVTVEQAIRSSTGLPADILKLPERGYLKKGYFADLVIFDPKTFRDTATFDQPHQYATGVRYLFVNGRVVIDEGRFTGARAGKALKYKS
jgi:N-acyl-D-aspartate/D-glutamate deacylase